MKGLNIWFYLGFTVIVVFGLVVRLHNNQVYDLGWADDGGAHFQYIMTIKQEFRLPMPVETYIAWHEPLYYVLAAAWSALGDILGQPVRAWVAGFNILIHSFFITVVAALSFYITKRRVVVLWQTFFFSVLFVGVKLSAYPTNELLAQALILLSIYLFLRWELYEFQTGLKLVWWSVVLAFALLVKMTAILVLMGAFIVWAGNSIKLRQTNFFWQGLLSISIVLSINSPWLLYKYQVFSNVALINVYPETSRHSLINSPAWEYLLKFRSSVFSGSPYWESRPFSATAMLISDTFGDHYGLFTNMAALTDSPPFDRLTLANGRFSTVSLFNRMTWVNRMGAFVSAIWLVALVGVIFRVMRGRGKDMESFWLLLMIGLGLASLVYYNLTWPYLSYGSLKIMFIYFTVPLVSILAVDWWGKLAGRKSQFALIFLLLLYVFAVWPVIYL